VECEGDCPNLTEWQRVLLRFYDLIGWENASGTRLGWNDLDSLEVGNGSIDGITDTEQQTAMTLWAMANAPMYLGGDLTKLISYGRQLLFNDEVLAVDQSGHPAKQVNGGHTPVCVSDLGNGAYYVALFNLNAFPTKVGGRLFRVAAVGHVSAPLSQAYGAQTATLYGGSQVSQCSTCASGYKLTYLGIGAANYAVFTVSVKNPACIAWKYTA